MQNSHCFPSHIPRLSLILCGSRRIHFFDVFFSRFLAPHVPLPAPSTFVLLPTPRTSRTPRTSVAASRAPCRRRDRARLEVADEDLGAAVRLQCFRPFPRAEGGGTPRGVHPRGWRGEGFAVRSIWVSGPQTRRCVAFGASQSRCVAFGVFGLI